MEDLQIQLEKRLEEKRIELIRFVDEQFQDLKKIISILKSGKK